MAIGTVAPISYQGSLAMCASPTGTNPQLKINSRFLPLIDKVLIAGLRNGPAGKRGAINKILHLVPEWKRGDCWRRIRQLRTSLCVEQLKTAEKPTKAHKRPLAASRQSFRPWTAEEDNCLLTWAGI